jgi:hypothetical protein
MEIFIGFANCAPLLPGLAGDNGMSFNQSAHPGKEQK